MDILLFKIDPLDINFYWMDKNRTFVLQEKDFKKDNENNFSYHPLKAILDGSYSLSAKTNIKNISFGIRVNDEIIYKDSSNKIYFKIDTKENNKISKIDKNIFVKKELKIKIGTGKSARKLWNLYWFNLHFLSYNYPLEPNENQKNQISKLTVKMTRDGLGCPRCRAHFIQWNKLNPISKSYNSKEELISWYINLHNDVNKRNNKKQFSRNEVDNIFLNYDYKKNVGIYKINILNLFNENKLDKFPDIINNDVKKRLWKENDIFKEYWLSE